MNWVFILLLSEPQRRGGGGGNGAGAECDMEVGLRMRGEEEEVKHTEGLTPVILNDQRILSRYRRRNRATREGGGGRGGTRSG